MMTILASPLSDLYAPIRGDLEVARRIFEDEIASELPLVNQLCDSVHAYSGKMLRPALLLLSGHAAGCLEPAHHTLAAVVELVHMATLVHDDVLDEADERRRHPTVRTVAGNVAAVLLGDYLISHAFHLCSSLDSQHASRRIGDTTNIVCEGELLQNSQRDARSLSEADYFEVIGRKTGSLTATSCELGAYYAGADATVVEAMKEYGLASGMAFQIIDDVLDCIGDRSRVGKTLGRDVALGKLTLPTIHCLATARPPTAKALDAALSSRDPAATGNLREWLDETNSVDYAVSVASDYVHRARAQLDLLPAGQARTALAAMAEFIIQRSF